MNKELTIFEGNELEILTKEDVNIEFNGECLFNGKQVCSILGYLEENFARDISRHCDEDCIELITKEKLNTKNTLSLGQRGTYFINEYGIMDLIINSKNIDNKKKKSFIDFLQKNSFIPKNDIYISRDRKEIKFLDKLKESLKPLNIIDGQAQYIVKNENGTNYRIDYYIPSLNVAIEYDEDNHKNYTYNQHEGRQKEIEDKLRCKFIRVSDKNSDEHNIGIVLKDIFEMSNNKCDNCGCNMELLNGEYICSNCGFTKRYNPIYKLLGNKEGNK